MAKTYRSRHADATSGLAPTPDLLAAMSGFRLIPSGLPSGSDVAGATGIRGVLTQSGPTGDEVRFYLKSEIGPA